MTIRQQKQDNAIMEGLITKMSPELMGVEGERRLVKAAKKANTHADIRKAYKSLSNFSQEGSARVGATMDLLEDREKDMRAKRKLHFLLRKSRRK